MSANSIETPKPGPESVRESVIEVLTHELSEAQKRQRDLYVDLDTRVRKLESGAPPGTGSTPAGARANGG